ncbi:hypothetical protein [Stenotrophomonas bentonitica]|uniref:hypothetical protein n=1 Tax=Stenotrophomonas bentonitica TaxID=1450134 RepID=UPI0031BA7CC6
MMGGGSNGSATKAAQEESWRQNNINQAVNQINAIYGGAARQADINDFLGASRSFYTNELEKQKGVADRSLKFAMARNGLTGGTASIDANRTLGENYQSGILSADRLAQQAAADLRTADDNSRMNLISQASTGMGLTSGAQQAAQAMQANLQGSRGAMKANALGDVFGGLSSIFDRSRTMADERKGFQSYGQSFYSPGYGSGGFR